MKPRPVVGSLIGWVLFGTLFVLPGVTTPAVWGELWEGGPWWGWFLALAALAVVCVVLARLLWRMWEAPPGRATRRTATLLTVSAVVVDFIALGPIVEGGRDARVMGSVMAVVGACLTVLAVREWRRARRARRGAAERGLSG